MSLDYLLRPSVACADLNDMRERPGVAGTTWRVGRRLQNDGKNSYSPLESRARSAGVPGAPHAVVVDYLRVFFMLQA